MQKQNLKQKLGLNITPQQIQFLGLLQIPITSLNARIQEEIEENPALEESEELELESPDFESNINDHYKPYNNFNEIRPDLQLSNHEESLQDHLKKQILLSEALSGLSIPYEHLSGKTILVEYDDIIIPNSTFKIEGYGFYNKNTGRNGNLIFEFEVIFPNNLDTQRKDLLNKLLPKRKENIDKSALECYKLEMGTVNLNATNLYNEEFDDINSIPMDGLHGNCAQQ